MKGGKEKKQNLNFFKHTTQSENVDIDVLMFEGGVWLTQKNIAELFGVGVNTINYHIKRLEIKDNLTIRKFRIVQMEGGRKIEREVVFYNFDVIMELGFRVNSEQACQFRDWFINSSSRYLRKSFVPHSNLDLESRNSTKPRKLKMSFSYTLSILASFLKWVVSLFKKNGV